MTEPDMSSAPSADKTTREATSAVNGTAKGQGGRPDRLGVQGQSRPALTFGVTRRDPRTYADVPTRVLVAMHQYEGLEKSDYVVIPNLSTWRSRDRGVRSYSSQ